MCQTPARSHCSNQTCPSRSIDAIHTGLINHIKQGRTPITVSWFFCFLFRAKSGILFLYIVNNDEIGGKVWTEIKYRERFVPICDGRCSCHPCCSPWTSIYIHWIWKSAPWWPGMFFCISSLPFFYFFTNERHCWETSSSMRYVLTTRQTVSPVIWIYR